MDCGSCVYGPRGWFPDLQLSTILTQNLGTELFSQDNKIPLSKASRSPKINNFLDYLDKRNLLVPYFMGIRANSMLENMGKKGTIPVQTMTKEHFESVAHTKSPHQRKPHTAFMWVKEENVFPLEPVYGRRIRKNTLVKVRREKKGSLVNWELA
jgi:hypothetical protein